MTFLFVLGFAMIAGVSYLAVSKQSERQVRLAALGALAVMIVTVIVCLIVYFKAASIPKQLFLPDMLPSDMPPPQSKTNPITMIMLIVFMVALFAIVFFLSMKEQRRTEGKEPPPSDDW